MLQSMTGFGKATADFSDKTITIEIRTLNSKGLDASLRMPTVYREKEIEIRAELAKYFERGKIDVSVNVEYRNEQPALQLNTDLAKAYYTQLKELAGQLQEKNANLLEMVLRMPDVNKQSVPVLTEEEYADLKRVLKQAMDNTIDFRKKEGSALAEEFRKRTAVLQKLLKQVEEIDPSRIEKIKTRIQKNISEFVTAESVDKSRLEQELIYYLEKIDVTEEKIRLATHINYFNETAKEAGAGRKLNFIAQEFGREVNTIGSKANDAEIQKTVVLMKDEVEKIKEQTLNVL